MLKRLVGYFILGASICIVIGFIIGIVLSIFTFIANFGTRPLTLLVGGIAAITLLGWVANWWFQKDEVSKEMVDWLDDDGE